MLPSVRESFDALGSALSAKIDNPSSPAALTDGQRASLVAFAEANINTGRDINDGDKAGVARVQAKYVAGMMAVLDGGQGRSPFKDSELTKLYDEQRNFGRTLDRGADQGQGR